MLIFLVNLVWSVVFRRERAEANPWQSKSLEWQLPSPVPVYNFERIPTITSHPYGYGTPEAPAVADFGRRVIAGEGSDRVSTHESLIADPEDPAVVGRNLAVGARLLASAVVFFFMAFVFAFFYLRALNTAISIRPTPIRPRAGRGDPAVRARLGRGVQAGAPGTR